ncbi:hypothetical protein HALA3H3_830063 [Halomonas sp. A3H3]|nr:hypothetical protein HALA3H3_830063 [Halomonas sp. A3H3]
MAYRHPAGHNMSSCDNFALRSEREARAFAYDFVIKKYSHVSTTFLYFFV